MYALSDMTILKCRTWSESSIDVIYIIRNELNNGSIIIPVYQNDRFATHDHFKISSTLNQKAQARSYFQTCRSKEHYKRYMLILALTV